jgi:hexosaminidase
MRAAIVAMNSRAKRLGSDEFLLVHPQDSSDYVSVQGWRGNVIDVCMPSTYRFLETVVADIVEIYDDAGVPLRSLHTGGDEVPQGVWEGSPACKELIASDAALSGIPDLHDYYVRKIDDILNRYGLTTFGWEEIALMSEERDGRTVHVPNPEFVDDDIKVNVWNAVWGWGGEGLAYALANAGYDVVISNASNYYFDFPYAKHSEESGLYWGGFVDTPGPFAFIPFDLYKGADQDMMGRSIDPSAYAGHDRLTEEGREHIIGLQGQLWSENIRSTERLEYMLFPRLISLAEKAWGPQPSWETMEDRAARRAAFSRDWNVIANALGQRELPRLDRMHDGVLYRIPPPGAVIEGGMLRANVALPGLTIRYTVDGSEPTVSSSEYTGPVAVSGQVKLKTFGSTGRGSRTVTVD